MKVLAVLLTAITMGAATIGHAQSPITYSGVENIQGNTVDLSFTTNGSIGQINIFDITGYNIIVSGPIGNFDIKYTYSYGAAPFSIPTSDYGACSANSCNGVSFTATPTTFSAVFNNNSELSTPYNTVGFIPGYGYLYATYCIGIQCAAFNGSQPSGQFIGLWNAANNISFASASDSPGTVITLGTASQPLPAPPAFSVTATLGGPLSNNGGSTSILLTATPTTSPTLAAAEKALGYSQFDWIQQITSIPQPVPTAYYTVGNPNAPTAPPAYNDPPKGGYQYAPGYNPYPFYYPASTISTAGYCLVKSGCSVAGEVPIESSSSISLFDAPADPCLPGGTGAFCGGATAATGAIHFTDELVGVIPCNTPGIGECSVDGFTESAPITFVYDGKDVTSLQWTDSFNGTSGGIPTLTSFGPVDAGSGTGGIVLISPAGAAPEPSTWILIFMGVGISGLILRRQPSKINYSKE